MTASTTEPTRSTNSINTFLSGDELMAQKLSADAGKASVIALQDRLAGGAK
jgi:hypothetical protein